jgi:hypothetical protein
MEYLLILNTFRIPRSSLDIQDGIYGLEFDRNGTGRATFPTNTEISYNYLL